MKEKKGNEERRLSERISDGSFMIVRGKNSKGTSFTETTRVNDVSSNGISFFLKCPVTLNILLELTIGELDESARQFTPAYAIQARVMSTIVKEPGIPLFRIGAQFEGEALPLENVYDPEDFAQKLQEAIEIDEQWRDLN
jgi:hypothetical protein